MTSPDKHAQMAVEGWCPLDQQYGDVVCRSGVLWGLTYSDCAPPGQRQALGDCPHCSQSRANRVVRMAESFGFTNPVEEQNYGTSDPIGFGDIEYPADVQPPKERA